MPAIVFPTAPTLNQQFTSGDRTWEWNGVTWSSVTSVIVGPTGPAGAVTNVIPTMKPSVNLVASWRGGTLSVSADRFGSGGITLGLTDSSDIAQLNTIPNGTTFTFYDSTNNPHVFVKNADATGDGAWDCTFVSGGGFFFGTGWFSIQVIGTTGKSLTNNGATSSWTSEPANLTDALTVNAVMGVY